MVIVVAGMLIQHAALYTVRMAKWSVAAVAVAGWMSLMPLMMMLMMFGMMGEVEGMKVAR